jgi:hypothetical protein
MELQIDGVELRIFVTEGRKTESRAARAVSSLRISRRIGRTDRSIRGLRARRGASESDVMPHDARAADVEMIGA